MCLSYFLLSAYYILLHFFKYLHTIYNFYLIITISHPLNSLTPSSLFSIAASYAGFEPWETVQQQPSVLTTQDIGLASRHLHHTPDRTPPHPLNIRHNLRRRRLFWMSSSHEASCYRMSHFSVSPLTAGLAAISSSSRESLTEALASPASPFSPVSSGAAVWRAQSCSSAVPWNQGVIMSCRLSWLTNSALVYEPKCGERGGGGLWGLSQSVQLYTGAQINFGDLSPYLTYAWNRRRSFININVVWLFFV